MTRWFHSGGWRTNVTYLRSPGSPADAGIVNSMEFDAQGTIVGGWDSKGDPVAVPPAPSAAAPPWSEFSKAMGLLNVRRPLPHSANRTISRAPRRTVAASTRPLPGAFDFWVATPESHRRAAAELSREHGSAVHSESLATYRSTRNGVVRKRVLDRNIGGLTEELTSEANGRTVHVHRTFVPVGDGRSALHRVETEITSPNGAKARIVQEYSRIQVGVSVR
jgi:hypothetical protein